MKKIADFMVPNVSKLPGQRKVDLSDRLPTSNDEFNKILNNVIGKEGAGELKISLHAAKRISERDIELSGSDYFKLKKTINSLKEMGGKDSLVITKNAAFIVDVDKNTIVTALDRESIDDKVFTKIDSTVIIS